MSAREPLPAGEFSTLKPGDQFIVYWAKDDNPEDVRLDDVTQTVVQNDGNEITTNDPGVSWDTGELITPEENCLDTSRGYAYLYKVTSC